MWPWTISRKLCCISEEIKICTYIRLPNLTALVEDDYRNYEQLGLNFKLYAAEVLFNKGICLVYLDRVQEGLDTMAEARTLKAKEDHDIIDEAIRDQGDGYTVFSVVCYLRFSFDHQPKHLHSLSASCTGRLRKS